MHVARAQVLNSTLEHSSRDLGAPFSAGFSFQFYFFCLVLIMKSL